MDGCELQEPRILTDARLHRAELVHVAGGQAAIYSARAPEKTGANEDAIGVLPSGFGQGVLAVADGLGGQPGGASAAQLAIECVRDSVSRAAAGSEDSLRGSILDGIERANQAVIELGIGAGTTLAAVELYDGTLRPYHVGDAGILVVGQRGRIKLQTISHSPVGYAVESGLLDAGEAMHHESRHLVSNLVGTPDMRIEVGSPLRLAARDTVLLASDGLLDNLRPAEIVEVIRARPLSLVAEILAQLGAARMQSPEAGEPSKPDDLSFVLFRLAAGPEGRQRSPAPAAPL